jgi:hypothetical protein
MNRMRIKTTGWGSGAAGAKLALAAATLIALGTLATSADAAVYKWVDPQGRVHYSDRPPPPEGKLLSVDMSEHARGEQRPAPSTAAAAPSGTSSSAAAPGASKGLKQAVDADVASAREERCKAAQDRYQMYIKSRRLYKEGPNKERIYLSDSELETERVNAKREADESCAGTDAR